jgi:hypothetical protein
MHDKRAHPRFRLWFPVIVEGTSERVAAVCNDVSSGGLGIASAGPIALGTEVIVTFRVTPGGEDRVAKGRVVRIEHRTENPREVWSHRLAIEFLEPQRELQEIFELSTSPPTPPPPSL